MAGRRIRPCARAARSPPPRGGSPRLRLPASPLLPLTFQHLSPLGKPSRNPFHVNAPRGQWARSGREPSTNGHGAAVLESIASPRDWLRAGSDRAAGQGLGRGQRGHCFIRRVGPGARGQRHFPIEERPVTARRLARGQLAKRPLPKQSPGRAKPSHRRSSSCGCIRAVQPSTVVVRFSQGLHA